MPCMGPGDQKKEAQEAFVEIAKLLRREYGVEIEDPETFGICKKQYNEAVAQLKSDLEEVFKLESYNSF